MKKFFQSFIVKKLTKRPPQQHQRRKQKEKKQKQQLPLSLSSSSVSTIVTTAPSDWSRPATPNELDATSLAAPQSSSSLLSAASSVAAYSNEYFKLPDGNYLVRYTTAMLTKQKYNASHRISRETSRLSALYLHAI
ncbi:hypothetical protein VTP01DRAFT_7791 [Rhizomucor pusillus]|uniref:uncharacterized protein n=1 Tax=Rhizomucor pusillus TaxID=4840 RepID=UPI003743B7B8